MANNDFMRTVHKNLPGIFTAGSIITGFATAALAVYEGWKLCEDWNPDAGTKDKVYLIARRLVPVLLGASASAGFCYAAHHESTKRIAALSAAVAAVKLDNEELKNFKNKAKEVLGEEKTKEVKSLIAEDKATEVAKKINRPNVSLDEEITVHDLETGYVFKTTLRSFSNAVNECNDNAETDVVSMADFYMTLEEGLANDRSGNLYSTVGFGRGCEVRSFRPEWDAEIGPDLKAVYTISYPYANLESGPRSYSDY